MDGSDGQALADGHALSVERVIDAGPEAIFDAFIAMYDSQRVGGGHGRAGVGRAAYTPATAGLSDRGCTR